MNQIITVEKTDYFAEVEAFSKKRAANDPAWVKEIRHQGMSSFRSLGFPTLEHEEWRYTPLDPIVKNSFRWVSEPVLEGVSLDKLELGHRDWIRLVFVNGFFSEPFSSMEHLPNGVKIENLGETIQSDSILAEQYLAKYAAPEKDAFTALNTAFIRDGAFIYIPKGVVVKKPIHLLYVSHNLDGQIMCHPRNLIVAGQDAQATIVESYVTLEDHVYFTNAVTEIVLGAGARISHYRDQKESVNAFHVASTQVTLDRDSFFSTFSAALGAELSRYQLHVDLNAEGAECDLSGLYFVTGSQRVDHHLVLDHKKPRGTSRQLFKGILDGRAHGVFSGKIFIRQDAQQTDAQQVNKNLLLSEGAKMDTQPQLEISADDVKATHGAAIGQLDEEEIFYLKSRGMGDANARALLTFGFASELIEKIKLDPIRWELDRYFWTRLQLAGEKHE